MRKYRSYSQNLQIEGYLAFDRWRRENNIKKERGNS